MTRKVSKLLDDIEDIDSIQKMLENKTKKERAKIKPLKLTKKEIKKSEALRKILDNIEDTKDIEKRKTEGYKLLSKTLDEIEETCIPS